MRSSRAGHCPSTNFSYSFRYLTWFAHAFPLGWPRERAASRNQWLSISHSDIDVRIWGYYAVIDGKDVEFYRYANCGIQYLIDDGGGLEVESIYLYLQ
jgi:hypothetical protein